MYLKIVVFYSLSIFSREVHTQSLTHANGWPDFLSLSLTRTRSRASSCVCYLDESRAYFYLWDFFTNVYLAHRPHGERKKDQSPILRFLLQSSTTHCYFSPVGRRSPTSPLPPRDLARPTLQKVKLFSLFSFVCLFVFSSHHKNRQRRKCVKIRIGVCDAQWVE